MEIHQLLNSRLDVGRRSSLIPEQFSFFADSILNEYVPYYSAFFAEFKRVGTKRFNFYGFPSPILEERQETNRTAAFVSALSSNTKPVKYLRAGLTYKVMKQCIYTRDTDDQPRILYMLAIKSDYLFGDQRVDLENLDYSKVVMLVDRQFESPDNRLMYNFVKREVIIPLLDLGVDLIQTNDINKWCFKTATEPMQFTTLAGMREYLHNFNNQIIDEVTGRERPTEISGGQQAEVEASIGRATSAAEAEQFAQQSAENAVRAAQERLANSLANQPAQPQPGIEVSQRGDITFRDAAGTPLWTTTTGIDPVSAPSTPTGRTGDLLRDLGYLQPEQPLEYPGPEPEELPEPGEDEFPTTEEEISAHIDSILARAEALEEVPAESVPEPELPTESAWTPWPVAPNPRRSGPSAAQSLGREQLSNMYFSPGWGTEES